jgi:hypothetical protein
VAKQKYIPLPDLPEDFIKNFWQRKVEIDGCWFVISNTGKRKEYINVVGKEFKITRIAYKAAFGDCPVGLNVCHRCDTPPCIKPEHLWLGTQKENVLDAVQKGRWAHLYGDKNPYHGKVVRRGEEHCLAKLTVDDVKHIRHLFKKGWTCRRIGNKFHHSQENIRHVVMRRSWKHIT